MPELGASGARPDGSRSVGVDVVRGAVIAWLLFVVHTPTLGIRGHAAWWGVDHSDLFFPAFLFVAGAGLALQLRDRPVPWPRLLKRFVTLTVLGLVVNAWLGDGADLGALRIPGVLQRIALVGLLGLVVVLGAGRRWWVVLTVAAVLTLAWSTVLFVASSDCPGHRPTPAGCGTLFGVDRAAFGDQHVYHRATRGHDPEGLVSTAGGLATFLVGYAAVRVGGQPRQLLAMAAGWLVLLAPLWLLQPPSKRLWTGSFVALTAAGALALLAACVAVFDRRGASRAVQIATWPLVALARNALVVWTGVFFVQGVLAKTTVAGVPLGPWFLDAHGPVAYLVVFGGGWLLVAMAMHAARWHVRL